MYVCMYVYLGLGGVLEVCGECYNIPLLSILFFKTKRNDLARPVMGTIFLVREYCSTLYVGLARAVSPTNTNFRLTFLLTRLQEALYET